MNLPRQTVNYHARQLARARLLTRAGRRMRRRVIEQCYVASAGAPEALMLTVEVIKK
jgi:hypothetical protein